MKIYIVRNQEGLYFRAKGMNGYGKTWVDEIERARIYAKIGPARSLVSYFFNNWPDFGVPDILEFDINPDNAVVLNESNRVNKQKKNKERAARQRQIRDDLRTKQYLEHQIAEARQRLDELK